MNEQTAQTKPEEKKKIPGISGNRIHEVEYAEWLKTQLMLIWTEGAFFGVNGRVTDVEAIRQRIFGDIRDHVSNKVSAKVDSILHTFQMVCGGQELEVDETRIHIANGIFDLEHDFIPRMDVCRYRLPVKYDIRQPLPSRWLSFLDELLEPEDILTLQEYMGYCLIPTNCAQKMLIITGRGGEGKSRIGYVMRGILGDNMSVGSIGKLETNPFSRADLEHKLLLVDDDLKLERLPSTNYLKTIITAEQPMDLERKGIQSYQGNLYCRLMAFGNGTLRAANDASYGFFRRQIILSTKPRPADRVDDPFLGRLLLREKDAIFNWCILGLMRLTANNFVFTYSRKSMENLMEAQVEGNPVVAFLGSKGYVLYGAEHYASTRQLYHVFRDWCEDNSIRSLAMDEFSKLMRLEAEQRGLQFDYNIPVGNGKRARGYRGICTAPRF